MEVVSVLCLNQVGFIFMEVVSVCLNHVGFIFMEVVSVL